MGADLYFTKTYKPNVKKYKPLFEKAVKQRDAEDNEEARKLLQKEVEKYYGLLNSIGYFRDSYNQTSLLQQFGLSWWKDIIPLLNRKDNLTPKACQTFLTLLKEHEDTFQSNLENFGDAQPHECWRENNLEVEKEKQEWIVYFLKKYTQLKQFLQKAIDENEPIEASL